MTLVRRTWVATAMFVLTSALAWRWFLNWEAAGRHFLQTLLLSPVIWWVVVGRKHRPGFWSGIVGGALTGLVTQMIDDLPRIAGIIARRGTFKGDEGLTVMGVLLVIFFMCVWSVLLGAIVGLVAVVIQRYTDGPMGRRPP